MRRERAYTLALRAHDAERALFELPRVSGTLLSQSEFRAAPGGARLAWLEGQSDGTNHSTLHVMADGSGELTVPDVRLFRFSPDGTQLAAVVTTAPQQSELVVVDLASDERRSLGALRSPFQLEWSAGAVMVLSMMRGAAVHDQLERIALDGERLHLLNEHCIDELAVAARASRAIYLTSCGSDSVSMTPHLVLANFATGSRRRIDLPGRESIDNLEISPDGKRAAWAIDRDVYLVDGKGPVARIAHERSNVHSLWFSDDGKQLLWASSDRVVLRHEHAESSLAAAVRSVRFRRDGAGVLIATDHEVFAWDPATGKRRSFGRTDATVEAADSFAGGVVTLTSVSASPGEKPQ